MFTLTFDRYNSVEVSGRHSTTLVIDDFKIEMDDSLAEDIMDALCEKIKGYRPERKIEELENEKEELEQKVSDLEEKIQELS